MGINATAKPKRDPIPEGEHLAICYAIVDLGTHISKQYGNAQRQVRIMFELPECKIKIDGKEVARTTSSAWTLTLGKKSRLRPVLESWRGKKFTEQELAGFDVTKLLGLPCRLMIVHEVRDGTTYDNIQTVIPAPKGLKPIKPENKQLYYSMDDHGPNIPKELPEFVVKKIQESEEYKAGFKPKDQDLSISEDTIPDSGPSDSQDEEAPPF